MTESEEFLPYAVRYSRAARDAREELSAGAQLALTEVIVALAEDPTGCRSEINPEDPKSLLYKHPEPPLVVTYELDKERQTIYLLHFAEPGLEPKKPLFISYSHADIEWLDELLPWLAVLEEDLIEIWVDRKIKPGENWYEEIDHALRSAKVAVLLVTQNFVASKFIRSEEFPTLLEAAENAKVKLLWVAVREATTEGTGLDPKQAVNDPNRPLRALRGHKRDQAYHRIHDAIKEALTS